MTQLSYLATEKKKIMKPHNYV